MTIPGPSPRSGTSSEQADLEQRRLDLAPQFRGYYTWFPYLQVMLPVRRDREDLDQLRRRRRDIRRQLGRSS